MQVASARVTEITEDEPMRADIISRCWCHPSSLLLASLMNKFTWVVTCVPPRTKNIEALLH